MEILQQTTAKENAHRYLYIPIYNITRWSKVSQSSMFTNVQTCLIFQDPKIPQSTIGNDFSFQALIPPNPVVWDSGKTATNRHFVWNFPLHGVNMCSWFVLYCNTMKCAQLVCTVLNTIRFYLYFTVTQWGWFVQQGFEVPLAWKWSRAQIWRMRLRGGCVLPPGCLWYLCKWVPGWVVPVCLLSWYLGGTCVSGKLVSGYLGGWYLCAC